jgi:hypothetical protein
VLDVVNVQQVVRLGEEAMEKALPELKQACTWFNRIRRRLITIYKQIRVQE